jgi:hypothetical protein
MLVQAICHVLRSFSRSKVRTLDTKILSRIFNHGFKSMKREVFLGMWRTKCSVRNRLKLSFSSTFAYSNKLSFRM